MFTDFHTFYPNPTLCLLLDYRVDGLEHMSGGGFAADIRQNPEIDQALARQILKLRQVRIVRRCDHGMVEHLVQPRSDRLQGAEVEAPAVLVQGVTREDEFERKRVAVEKVAMRVFGPPLPEATR